MTMPLIFVTNDDGIHSPGLRAAVEAVLNLGDVLVVAPTHQQTSMGRSLPSNTDGILHPIPYQVRGRKVPAYHINGSPAQAVMYGLLFLCDDRRPDVLVAGINYGENLGTGITISGTVGAALQSANMGIPGLAISLETDKAFHYHHGEVEWDTAIHFTRLFTRHLLAGHLPPDVDVLKVDVPRDATPETPWRVTRLSRHPYYAAYLETPAPEGAIGGRLSYRVAADPARLEPDSDIYAFLVDRVVTVVPLSLDLTSRVDLRALDSLLRDGAEPATAARPWAPLERQPGSASQRAP